MEKKGRETAKKKKTGKGVSPERKPKSAFTLFWEKYPDGAGEIIDMRAVLR
jgi:hypothetical protein